MANMATQERLRLSPARARLFRVATLVVAVLVCEAMIFVALWIRDGRAPTPDQRRAEISSVLADYEHGSDATAPGRAFFDVAEIGTLHPYIGYTADPDRVTRANVFGFTGNERPLRHRAPDTLLVGIAGGSVAEGFSLFGMEPLERSLSDHPEFRGRTVVPVNMGFSGYKQPQQLMALIWLLSLGGELDYLINLDGFNEVALHNTENVRKNVFPAYPQAWFLFLDGIPDPGLVLRVGRRKYLAGRITEITRDHQRSWTRFSVIGFAVWDVRRRILERERAELGQEIDELRSRAEALVSSDAVDVVPYRIKGPESGIATEGDLFGFLADTWRRGSLQLDRLCRANGIRYLHFLQPNQYVEDSKPMGATERRLAWREDQPYRQGVEKGYPMLRREGRRLVGQGVAFHDLTQVFAGVEEPRYVDDCCHFDEQGYDRIAKKVAQAMIEKIELEGARR